MKRNLWVLVLGLLTTFSARADNYTVDRHIGTENGLSNNYVLDLAIDGNGFVWVATESGLNRIAGTVCSVYRKETAGAPLPTEIVSNAIRSLHYDKATDQMLVGTDNGLSVYDCQRGVFRAMTREDGLAHTGVNDIVAAGEGGVWLILDNGAVQHLDCQTLRLRDLPLKTLRGNRSGYDDGHGHLYLGHKSSGLTVVNLKNGHTRYYRHEDRPLSLPGDNVRSVYMDKKRNIWVGTNHGLALFDPVKETFTPVRHQGQQYDDNVHCIREMSDGTIWVANDMGGIHIVGNDDRVILSSINTRCVRQDEFGNIWVGNHSTGVDFISANKSFFNTLGFYDGNKALKRVYGVACDEEGNIWLGGEDELSLCRDNEVVRTWQVGARENHAHSLVHSLLPDRQGRVWLGMEDEGVILFDTKTQRFQHIDIGLNAPDIRSLYEDRQGRIWIGSEHGVFTWKDGKVTDEAVINDTLKKDVVSGIVEAPDGRMLFATLSHGLYAVDLKTLKAQNLNTANGLPSRRVNDLFLDRDKGLWIATTEGLAYIRDLRKLDDIEVFDQRQGLKDTYVQAILQDRSEHIWISTYTGISSFDISKKSFYNYNNMNNLPGGSFVSGSATMTGDGVMYFGSPKGVCYFNPQLVNSDYQVSAVQIVACEAYNPAGNDTRIIRLIPDERGRVYATYRQNTLGIQFSVKDYSQIGNVEYSYMMKGMNDRWYYLNDDDDIVFRGLPPGDYTFILRAKLKNQDWTDASTAQLDIHIAPPLWLTWWAKLLYVLLLAGIAWYLLRNYKRKLQLTASLEMERRDNEQRQELNEERMRFFTNVTHELRTPLTLILGPLEDLVNDTRLPEIYHQKVMTIHTSAKRLRNLINDLLEFRKSESQNRRLSVAKGDLGALVKEIGKSFKELNRNQKVAMHLIIRPGIPPLYFDSEVVSTILNNFLSNAFKYTEEGSVNVIMNADANQHVYISVADTGCGIDSEALPHIFERYYQGKNTQQASGTGIGLALVKSLADLHEGRLSVESEVGKGSKFTFSLDVDNTYPNALHKDDSPVAGVSQETAEETEAAEDIRPLILVVEDNEDIRQYIADSLSEDYRVIQAAHGREGLEMATGQIPDLIVSDIMMPVMNGIVMTRQLKEDVRTSHIPIVLLTAKDSMEDKEEGYDSGADSYLTKPFSAKLLQSRIQNILSNRRHLAELLTFRNNGLSAEPEDTAEDRLRLGTLDQEFMDRLNRVIEEHITTTDLDMAFLTDQMSMSHSTFYRKVKALTGMTAMEYVRKLRLRRSGELLRSGYNVTEAATMTGFNDLSNFRELFKKEFGVVPSKY